MSASSTPCRRRCAATCAGRSLPRRPARRREDDVRRDARPRPAALARIDLGGRGESQPIARGAPARPPSADRRRAAEAGARTCLLLEMDLIGLARSKATRSRLSSRRLDWETRSEFVDCIDLRSTCRRRFPSRPRDFTDPARPARAHGRDPDRRPRRRTSRDRAREDAPSSRSTASSRATSPSATRRSSTSPAVTPATPAWASCAACSPRSSAPAPAPRPRATARSGISPPSASSRSSASPATSRHRPRARRRSAS